ncbi:hypothetical protein Tco_0487927 [Tanacetum coccineum]
MDIELAYDLMVPETHTRGKAILITRGRLMILSENSLGHQQQTLQEAECRQGLQYGTGQKEALWGISAQMHQVPSSPQWPVHPRGATSATKDISRRRLSEVKNKDGGNGNAQGWVYAVRNAEKRGNAPGNPDANVVTGLVPHLGEPRSYLSKEEGHSGCASTTVELNETDNLRSGYHSLESETQDIPKDGHFRTHVWPLPSSSIILRTCTLDCRGIKWLPAKIESIKIGYLLRHQQKSANFSFAVTSEVHLKRFSKIAKSHNEKTYKRNRLMGERENENASS